ncbi:MAG: response regulator transcription factor [Lentisphaerae bacterium]|nr:response regulator transcription factor [Lentisphaerota bacterium]
MTTAKQTILVAEDDEAIMLGLKENLKFAGYEVLTTKNGVDTLEKGMSLSPDLILLDIMLPGMSGYDVCRKLRDAGRQMPILMLTARTDEFDKVHGFEMGADDYVTKPFSINELLARIAAILRRASRKTNSAARYEFGDCVLDGESRILTKSGKEIPLTRTEFDLLAYFCEHDGKALSREVVLNEVWGTEYFGTQRSLDSFVASLRGKIEEKAGKPKHILTIHGVGYKFVK